MTKPTRLIGAALLLAALLPGIVLACKPTPVWLVRHAEAGQGPDPALTAAGVARADAWHAELGEPTIEVVFATDTQRSRDTAAAIAADAGARVELYDPARPDLLVERLRELMQPAVVVGHSNTLVPMAELFGADGGAPIAHDEHDRVYAVGILPVASHP